MIRSRGSLVGGRVGWGEGGSGAVIWQGGSRFRLQFLYCLVVKRVVGLGLPIMYCFSSNEVDFNWVHKQLRKCQIGR